MEAKRAATGGGSREQRLERSCLDTTPAVKNVVIKNVVINKEVRLTNMKTKGCNEIVNDMTEQRRLDLSETYLTQTESGF